MAASLHFEVENGGIETIDETIAEEIKELNQELEAAELEIVKQQIRAFKPIYEKRKKVIKKIPKFWSQVLTKHIPQHLANDDDSVVQHIDDITVERDENSLENFKIVLSFSKNEYFKNKELVKEFIVDADGQRKIKSTPIDWFDGRDYTKKRKADEEDDDQSFIKWFSEENADDSSSWELGKNFRDDIYHQALMIYMAEYDDEDDEEEGINQDFDEEESEEEEEVPTKRAKHN
ncbi:hypothetical protein RclHR1_02390015 [Rhizophagus clarus]|nr:hypothetical protein RclHR1_02390015 [Rhizophagus clarus]